MAKWVSQCGMQVFLTLFASLFFFTGLLSFFDVDAKKLRHITTTLALIEFFIFSLGIGQTFREFLLNPTQEISRKFGGIIISWLIITSVLIDLLIVRFYGDVPENKTFFNNLFLWIVVFPSIFLFCLNFMIWIFTHIALYCKAKSARAANQENTEKIQA